MSKSIRYTNVGCDHSNTPELRALLDQAITALTWRPIEELPQIGLMPGMGIRGAIRFFHMPIVSHFSDSPALAPFGFYGIEAHYSNAHIRIYFVDEGNSIVPVAVDELEVTAKVAT